MNLTELRTETKLLTHEEMCAKYTRIDKTCKWIDKKLVNGLNTLEAAFWELSRDKYFGLKFMEFEYIHRHYFTKRAKYDRAVKKLDELTQTIEILRDR